MKKSPADVTNLLLTDFKVDGIHYNIISGTQNAEVTPINNRYSGSIIIPESVSYGDTTYYITSIGDEAFYGCRNLVSITIPDSVTTIRYRAFAGVKWRNRLMRQFIMTNHVSISYK